MATASTGLGRIIRDLAPETPFPETSTGALEGSALAAIVRIVELQLRQVPLDTLTAEVLPAMLAIFAAPAGALLLYRREDATLTLAAARGLATAGAEALDVLRWGDEHGSEMPLRALVDRKIYVVERPHDDPFARRLVGDDQRRPVSSIAAVPLYRWHLPVGVMLVLAGEAGLAPDALLAPSFAYSVLALALSTLMWAREERGAIPLPAPDTAPPPLICVPWVDRRETSSTEVARLEAERDAAIAAARTEGRSAVEAGIAAARAESQRALEAIRAEGRAALERMLEELRAAVSGMEAERQAAAQERSVLGERLASFEEEHQRLADKLAATEEDRSFLSSRLASLEDALTRRPEAGPAMVAAPAATVDAPATGDVASAAPPRPTPAPAAPGAPATPARPAEPTVPASTAPAERRVLESDPTLRDHIQTALATAIPAGRGNLAAANLVGCDATRVAELAAVADGGTLLVGYARHPERGSRILGPLRCFVAPPTAAEIAVAIEGPARGNRRTILLSEDIDAFMAAKTALAKAGHSVSMACDEKQALDLLAILRPDTVLVDVRGAGQPAVEFLDALGPESGRILTLLVHGDPTGAALSRLAERMLRPNPLDVNDLVKVCRNALPDTRRAGAAPTRPSR
jgi:hypothetical protein